MKLEGKKILLVEDDNFIGDMFVRKLKAEGALCTRAISGNDGLKKLAIVNNDFDVIVTDVMMADMDGYEMVLKIKETEVANMIPIVVLTNRTSLTEENARIANLDIEAIYTKSDTSLSDLVTRLADIIQKHDISEIIQ
ncbi:MAG: DNA-binding response OmpR family regulator [Acidimicrobiales bacterium]|jgi:DNA-binding response OmpR family regulator